ncbi:MAG: DUF2029 domain-containing protein [Bacteroidales bacterium]|nr:DUF2029 domain-containing protein [Bacteroidales bacterium]
MIPFLKTKTGHLLFHPRTVLILYIVFTVAASTQVVLLGKKTFTEGGREYTHYNNYVIFKNSFHHLIQDKDLYIHYPGEYHDLFKYSPSFALIFGALAFLPDFAGIVLWNLINALMLYFAMFSLPGFTGRTKAYMLLLVIIELMTSMQNTQSNALIAGLIILAFVLLEHEKPLFAALCIVSTVFIKIFGIVALALFIFYPGKVRLVLYSLFWSAVFIFLPLPVVGFSQLKFLYSGWFSLLVNDHSISEGISVIGWLYSWFNMDVPKGLTVIIGIVVFLMPLIRVKQYSNYSFRLLTLSSVLIWMIIFNHKAESATFIIAISGVVIWYFSQERKAPDHVLLILAFIFTSLSPTDIFPKTLRINFFQRYKLKAVPCIAVWLKICYELIFKRYQRKQVPDIPEHV